MRLFIIRHADPDYENNTITAEGHLEAQALAKRIAAEKVDHIYCSPLGRAIDTMRYTADAMRAEHTVAAWTKELSLCRTSIEPWGELAAWDLPGEVVRSGKTYPSADDPGVRAQFEELRQASDTFLKHHGYEREDGRYRCVAPTRERIAVFCHGGFGLAWLAHLLELPLPLVWSGMWLPPSSVTTVLFEQRSAEWAVPRCIGMGDVSHLYAAGLPVRPRGIHALNW